MADELGPKGRNHPEGAPGVATGFARAILGDALFEENAAKAHDDRMLLINRVERDLKMAEQRATMINAAIMFVGSAVVLLIVTAAWVLYRG